MRYQLNIAEIYGKYSVNDNNRVGIQYGDTVLFVEEYAKKFFEKYGYIVLFGEDLHLFLWFCCGRFPVYGNESFENLNQFIKLNKVNDGICISDEISNKSHIMIDNAVILWKIYFENKRDILERIDLLTEAICIFSDEEIVNLLGIYASSAYDMRGAPDLFVYNKLLGEKQFVEVKSFKDSLRYEQLLFASRIRNRVGDLFTIMYVLPKNFEEWADNSIKLIHLNIEVNYLKRLYQMVPDAECNENNSVYLEFVAMHELHVSPNSFRFYLNKMKGINVNYDSKSLEKNDISLTEYLSKLEAEWIKLVNSEDRQMKLL